MQATISAKSGGQATCVREKTNWALIIIRILTAFAGLMIFFPEVNPGRLMSDINANTSLFTAAISYSTLTDSFARPLRMGWVQPWHFYLIMGGCALMLVGIVVSAVGACMSLGNHRMKRAAVKLPLIGSVLMLGGVGMLVYLNSILPALEKADRLKLMTPTGAMVFWAVLGGLILLFSIVSMVTIPKDMEEKLSKKGLQRMYKRTKDCTAMILYNDEIAGYYMDFLADRGLRVPDDISIVSFDDVVPAHDSEVKLVSVIHPKYNFGRLAARHLLRMMEDPNWQQNSYSYRFPVTINDGNSIKNIK